MIQINDFSVLQARERPIRPGNGIPFIAGAAGLEISNGTLTWVNAHKEGLRNTAAMTRPSVSRLRVVIGEGDDAMRHTLRGDKGGPTGVSAGLVRLASNARLAIAAAWQRHALRRELANCAMKGDLDAILAEVGLARGEIEPLVKGHPEGGRLLQAMSERLGVDKERTRDPAIQREMQRTCALCIEHRRCRHWLRAGRVDGYQDFCPNAELLGLLRRRVAARSEPID